MSRVALVGCKQCQGCFGRVQATGQIVEILGPFLVFLDFRYSIKSTILFLFENKLTC